MDPPKPNRKGGLYDYFHVNSVAEDDDGDLLISARNTQAVYKIGRDDGQVVWRLGGKKSDFAMGRGTRFAWQHDARRRADGLLTLFDNGAAPKVEDHSRVLVLRLDTKGRRATLVQSFAHPARLLSGSQGNAQFLPNGHVFVGWGANPYFTEFDAQGRVLFDAHFNRSGDSYRAYRFAWTGLPTTRPAVVASVGIGDQVTLFASWNGATEVARWEVLAGDDREQLRPVYTAAKTGFETAITVETDARYVGVRALGRRGGVLGASRVLNLRR